MKAAPATFSDAPGSAAAKLHISRSRGCQAASKEAMSLPTVYRPSKRAEDQEEGPVGAPDTWPVRPEGGRYYIIPDILKTPTSLYSDVD